MAKTAGSSLLRGSEATKRLARLQRRINVHNLLPSTIAVLPLDQRTQTSPLTAAIGLVAAAIIDHPLVVVDGDGSAQPMRRLLDSRGGGDIVGLAASHDASLRRRRVEDFVDMAARVPLAACWLDGPGAIPPEVLRGAVWKLQRRFPSVVMDLPHGCPGSTIGIGTSLASHVVLVADRHDVAHSWLHTGRSILADAARQGAVTIAAVGGEDSDRSMCEHDDVVPVPQLLQAGYSANGFELPVDEPERLAGVFELVTRALTNRVR